MNDTVVIRPIREADARAVLDLLRPIITRGNLTIMQGELSIEEQIEYIRGFGPGKRGVCNVAVLEEDGRIVGIQSIEPFSAGEIALAHVGEISTFVAMEMQGCGIGRKLSERTFDQAREQGFLKVMAIIRGDNPQALSFYRILGFDSIGIARRLALVNGRFVVEVFTVKLLEE